MMFFSLSLFSIACVSDNYLLFLFSKYVASNIFVLITCLSTLFFTEKYLIQLHGQKIHTYIQKHKMHSSEYSLSHRRAEHMIWIRLYVSNRSSNRLKRSGRFGEGGETLQKIIIKAKEN